MPIYEVEERPLISPDVKHHLKPILPEQTVQYSAFRDPWGLSIIHPIIPSHSGASLVSDRTVKFDTDSETSLPTSDDSENVDDIMGNKRPGKRKAI